MRNFNYGTSSASTMSGGNPSQRQPYEAPACVQNAMMTKDKKPFTYTPGGIDLSQIKSERMAKRLARNAQAEGATGASQINRPTQQPGSPCGSPSAASIGAAAMGMPFQVFPADPTPPPPASPANGKQHIPPGNVVSAAAPLPPPPPPPSSNTLAPSTNRGGALAPGSPNAARKSPNPQRFEPPPLGFRPEIKIPPNPMAALKKITPPVEKNSFWVDEYRKERSKSPMVNANESNTENIPNGGPEAGTNNDDVNKKSSSIETTAQEPTINNINHNNNINNNYQQYSPPTQQSYSPKMQQQEKPQQSPPLAEFRSVAPPQSPAHHVYTLQQPQQQLNEAARGPNSAMQPQRTTESPFKYAQQQQQRPVQPSSPLAQQLQQPSAPSPTNSTSSSNGSKLGQTVPWRTQRGPQAQLQQQQQHPQPIYNNVKSRDVYSPAPEGPKPTNVGSLYIAPLDQPVEPQDQNIVRQQMLQQQQQQMQEQQLRQPPTARWMSTQPVQKEQPAWARPEENGNVVPSSLQRIKSPPPAAANIQQQHRPIQGNGYANSQDLGGHAPSHSTGLRLQIITGTNNQSGAPKERIIPKQLEQTPTPTQTPAQSNFGSQPHYNSINNRTGSVAPSSYVMGSPNQFVDQGYNNYSELPPPHQQQQHQQQLHFHVVVPLQQHTNNSDINKGGGPKTRIIPVMIEGQSGARGPISQSPIVIQNDQRTPPVQSKSFRVLQKITDTIGDDGNTVAGVPPTSAPVEGFADAEPQLQRPQYARQMSAQQARKSPNIDQMKRMQIAQDQQQLWPQGNAVTNQQQQQQLNKYPQQRTIYNEDIPQKYVHPSEQQVPEPKKYTGSAIPSRSFKILQAMTTPENAGPGQSDL